MYYPKTGTSPLYPHFQSNPPAGVMSTICFKSLGNYYTHKYGELFCAENNTDLNIRYQYTQKQKSQSVLHNSELCNKSRIKNRKNTINNFIITNKSNSHCIQYHLLFFIFL